MQVDAYVGLKELVELLMTKGADVHAKDNRKVTPLHKAVRGGEKEGAELLSASDADVNAKDDDGGTPLDTAIRKDSSETAALLRKHGAMTGEE